MVCRAGQFRLVGPFYEKNVRYILHLCWHRHEYNLAEIHYHVFLLHPLFSLILGKQSYTFVGPVHSDKSTRGQVRVTTGQG